MCSHEPPAARPLTPSWYPGHMHRTRRELGRRVRGCQGVIEMLDARAPAASANPLLQRLCAGLPKIRVLNKADLAEPEVTALWLQHFQGEQDSRGPARPEAASASEQEPPSHCLAHSPEQRLGRGGLEELLRRLCPPPAPGERLQVLVTGIPNVGKSTFINRLCNRAATETGGEPAVTRRLQTVALGNSITLLDTPGMMWPANMGKADDKTNLLAILGSIRNTALDTEDVGWQAAELLLQQHPAAITDRYGAAAANPEALLHQVARHRGALSKGGHPNLQRAAELLLNDLRSGKLGRLSFERPN